MNEDIDLEDIEARLYGQIHHGAPENIPSLLDIPVAVPPGAVEKFPALINIPVAVSVRPPISNSRYYQTPTIPVYPPFIRPPPRQFQNNVYINPNIHHLNQFGNSPRLQPQFDADDARVQRQREKTKRRKERKERKKQKKVHVNPIVDSEVICLSDDEDFDEIPTTAEKSPSSDCKDDDVIFIEPEPVPLIHIEADEEKSESDTSTIVLNSPTGSASSEQNSNDFLESPMNDGLNKSRFNATTALLNDFIKPSNPTEMYETESSCSTTDLNKDIANTLKAVVFNEVEFPRDDMFSGSNLDEFSNYITPQRKIQRGKKQKTATVTPKTTKAKKSVSRESSTDSSSSESEYEQPINARRELLGRNLPTLSPIVQNSPARSPVKGSTTVNLNETSAKKKRKKKSSENREENVDLVAGKKKKKSKKAQNTDECSVINDSGVSDQQFDYSASTEETSVTPLGTNRKRKKSRNLDGDASVSQPTSGPVTANIENSESLVTSTPTDNSKRRKKSKRSEGGSFSEDQSTSRNDSNVNTSENNKGKRRRRSETVVSETVPEPVCENTTVSSPSSVSTVEQHETTHLDSIEENSQSESIAKGADEASDDLDDVILIEQPIETIDLVGNSQVEEIEGHAAPSSSKSSDVPLDFSFMEVVDEVGSTTDTDQAEQDEAYDFADFDDVGNDLNLVNCSQISDRYSNFDMDHIFSIQSNNPNDWKILPYDRIQQYRKSGPRCAKCRDFGHLAVQCPSKFSPPRCNLCGRVGHFEPRCPNKLCTQCGNRGTFSTNFCYKCVNYRNIVCTICKIIGHGRDNCPDLWRRYYLTTEAGLLVTDDPLKMKSSDELWCCGCAQQGHLEHNCMYSNRQYPPTIPYIQSFEDVYGSCAEKAPTDPKVGHNERNIILGDGQAGQTCNISIQITNSPILVPNPVNAYSSINQQNFRGQQEQDFTQDVFEGFLFDSNLDNLAQSQPQDHQEQYEPNAKILRKLKRYSLVDQQGARLFEMHPGHVVQSFIMNELKKLHHLSEMSSRGVKKFCQTYRSISNKKPPYSAGVMRKQGEVYQKANMLVFGVHLFGLGKRHMENLNNFVFCKTTPYLTKEKCLSLYEAYFYIFAKQKQKCINYTKLLRIILSKVDNDFSNP